VGSTVVGAAARVVAGDVLEVAPLVVATATSVEATVGEASAPTVVSSPEQPAATIAETSTADSSRSPGRGRRPDRILGERPETRGRCEVVTPPSSSSRTPSACST
jgi:hypothetical protein